MGTGLLCLGSNSGHRVVKCWAGIKPLNKQTRRPLEENGLRVGKEGTFSGPVLVPSGGKPTP